MTNEKGPSVSVKTAEKEECEHESLEIFDPRTGNSPWSDDCDALFSLSRNDAEGSALKVRICKKCATVYAEIRNWPDPDKERRELEDENVRLRAELEALKATDEEHEEHEEHEERD